MANGREKEESKRKEKKREILPTQFVGWDVDSGLNTGGWREARGSESRIRC
jgi:hypothetical protein